MGADAPSARVLVVGNEKGGSGKSTTAMHLMAALLRAGLRVGALDLDRRQGTLGRYLQNRRDWMARGGATLPMPTVQDLPAVADDPAISQEAADVVVAEAVAALRPGHDWIVMDTPGSDSALSRAGHAWADVLVTPLNDSFVDLDGLGRVDPATRDVVRPGAYAQMVFERKIARARRGEKRAFDWVVLRSRMAHLESRNQRAMDKALRTLSKRIGFRLAPGFAERVIFRSLFLDGLTLLDLPKAGSGVRWSLSHVAARQEVRALLEAIGLPTDGV